MIFPRTLKYHANSPRLIGINAEPISLTPVFFLKKEPHPGSPVNIDNFEQKREMSHNKRNMLLRGDMYVRSLHKVTTV